MKKVVPFLFSCFLIIGTAACHSPAKTSSRAPDRTDVTTKITDREATDAATNDAQSQIRRQQLNADIRAREERNNWAGGDEQKNPTDLASQVRSKLEANLPNSHLAVEAAKDGTVYVTGTVANSSQFGKVAPLAREIKGVSFVEMKVTVANANTKVVNNQQ